MSKYIDADKVLKELHLNHKDVIYIDKNDTAKRIEKIPSIDIVRCKECRYFYTEERFGETVHFCKHFNDVRGYWAKINPDDFCSYGERSGE